MFGWHEVGKTIENPLGNLSTCLIATGIIFSYEFTMELISLGRGFYSTKCSSEVVQTTILSDGPWFILGCLVWVQQWVPGFQPSAAVISKFPVWLHLPELPMEFHNRNILEKIGNGLGKVLKIDTHSIEGGKRRYAAICTLMDNQKPPPTRVRIGGISQVLLYNEGPWWCSTCHKVGHATRGCLKNSQQNLHLTKVNQEDNGWFPARHRGQGENQKEGDQKKAKDKSQGEVKKSQSQRSRWTPRKVENQSKNKQAAVSDKGESDLSTVVETSKSAKGDLITQNSFTILQNLDEPDGKSFSSQHQESIKTITPSKNERPGIHYDISLLIPSSSLTPITSSTLENSDRERVFIPAIFSPSETPNPRAEPGVRRLSDPRRHSSSDRVLLGPNVTGGESIYFGPHEGTRGSPSTSNVCKLGINAPSYAPDSGGSPSTQADENIPLLVSGKGSHSGDGRPKLNAELGSLVGPGPSLAIDTVSSISEIHAGSTSRNEQHRCSVGGTTPTPSETVGDHSLLGRGKREKKPSRGRVGFMATPEALDMPKDRQRSRSVGNRKRGDSKEDHAHSKLI